MRLEPFSFTLLAALTCGSPQAAEPYIPAPEAEAAFGFSAEITPGDRQHPSGRRLGLAEIILQDRANVHQLGRRDPRDSNDCLSRTAEGRVLLERLLQERLDVSPDTESAVVNGTLLGQPIDPVIYVYVYAAGVMVHGEGIDGDCGCDCAPPGDPDC